MVQSLPPGIIRFSLKTLMVSGLSLPMSPARAILAVKEDSAKTAKVPPTSMETWGLQIPNLFSGNEPWSDNINIQSIGVYLYPHCDPLNEGFGASLICLAQGNNPDAFDLVNSVFVKCFRGVCRN